MIRLILQHNRVTVLAFVVILATVAIIVTVLFLHPQTTTGTLLGNPNAPVVATATSVVAGQPPVARPAAVPLQARRAADRFDSDAPANLIDARMPDARLHDTAVAAVQCAVRRPLARDPVLDVVAIETWRAEARGNSERVHALIAEHQLKGISLTVVGRDAPPSSDPCVFGGKDLRTIASPSWDALTSVGVAVFPEPADGYPVSTLVIVGR